MSQAGVPDPNVRASDADRERIVEQLRQHTAEGRLTMEEFDERMSAAYAARTYGDLAELTRDLPVDLAARSRGGAGTPPWQRPTTVDSGSTGGGTAPNDIAAALVGAAMDWKSQRHQFRDQMRHQRHQTRLARRRRAPLIAATAGWAGMSMMLTGIWFVSGLTDRDGFSEFWPIWPIGIVGLIIFSRIIRGASARR